VAKQQGAALLELRAAVSLARAAIAIGQPNDGLGALRALCSALPPAFDTANLVEARELLRS
jgi:predicted ATPase